MPNDEFTEGTAKENFHLSLLHFYVRELLNRNALYSSYAAAINRLRFRFELCPMAVLELVYVALCCPCLLTLWSVLRSWLDKKTRNLLSQQGVGISFPKRPSREAGHFIKMFIDSCHCFLVRPVGSIFSRYQPTNAFPGIGERFYEEKGKFLWKEIEEGLDVLSDAVCILQQGLWHDSSLLDSIHGGGRVVTLSFPSLCCMVGLVDLEGAIDRRKIVLF